MWGPKANEKEVHDSFNQRDVKNENASEDFDLHPGWCFFNLCSGDGRPTAP
jgi:hypothetical protein